jgi:hypothetical protein
MHYHNEWGAAYDQLHVSPMAPDQPGGRSFDMGYMQPSACMPEKSRNEGCERIGELFMRRN